MRDRNHWIAAAAIILVGVCSSVSAFAACPNPVPQNTICLEWQSTTTNEDASPYTDPGGYKIYYGLASNARNLGPPIVINDPSNTQTQHQDVTGAFSITSPANGGTVEVYFQMTAFDSSNNESAFSNEIMRPVSFPDGTSPNAPVIMTIIVPVES